MNWVNEVRLRQKRKNQILFGKDSECLQDLIALLRGQNHRTIALWAFEFADESIALLEEKYPDENRPREALEAAWDWAGGKIKMHLAQRKILDCHAIGQACAVVHTTGHAIGYPIYDLSAIVYRLGTDHCLEAVEQRRQQYIDRLFYWNEHVNDVTYVWAKFMLD